MYTGYNLVSKNGFTCEIISFCIFDRLTEMFISYFGIKSYSSSNYKCESL